MTQVTQLNFGAIFDSLPTPFLVMDTHFNIVAQNPAYLDATLRSRDGLIGVNIFTTFPARAESRRILQESFERVRHRGVIDRIPMVSFALPLGDHFEERLWSCTHVPICNKYGEVAFLLKNTRDISKLREPKALADEASTVRVSLDGPSRGRVESSRILTHTLSAAVHHLFHSLMQASNFICVLRKPDLVFEFAGHAFLRLAGGRDLIGKPLCEALPEIAIPNFLRELENVLQTEEVFVARKVRFSLRNTRDGVEEHYLDFVAQPIAGPDSEVTALLVLGHDVTNEVRTEQSQALLIRELHYGVTNLLATLQAVGTSTAKSSATIEEFQKGYASRLALLADVMTRPFDHSVSSRHLRSRDVSPHSYDQDLRGRPSDPSVDAPSHHCDSLKHGGS